MFFFESVNFSLLFHFFFPFFIEVFDDVAVDVDGAFVTVVDGFVDDSGSVVSAADDGQFDMDEGAICVVWRTVYDFGLDAGDVARSFIAFAVAVRFGVGVSLFDGCGGRFHPIAVFLISFYFRDEIGIGSDGIITRTVGKFVELVFADTNQFVGKSVGKKIIACVRIV